MTTMKKLEVEEAEAKEMRKTQTINISYWLLVENYFFFFLFFLWQIFVDIIVEEKKTGKKIILDLNFYKRNFFFFFFFSKEIYADVMFCFRQMANKTKLTMCSIDWDQKIFYTQLKF